MSQPDPTRWPVGKAGYVAVVGRPNVGKSTFLNRVLGGHFLAVSALPQTTRRHWRGILTEGATQIVFVDTPGAHIGKTKLNEEMLACVLHALDDADAVLCMADPTRVVGDEDALVAERVARAGKPTALVLNKADVAANDLADATRGFYLERLGQTTPCFVVSAATGLGVEALLGWVRERLPKGPFFYPPDQAMDAVERDIGAEIVREAALEKLHQEVPHALAVEILQWQEQPNKVKIDAVVYVEREGQKAIVIGQGGSVIKAVRSQAVKQLRDWLGTRIELTLHVKVAADWRNRLGFLEEQGLVGGR